MVRYGTKYFIIDPKTNEPLGYDNCKDQGEYYCSVHSSPRGWQFANYHMAVCAYAGINICRRRRSCAWTIRFKLEPAQELKLAIIYTWHAIYCIYASMLGLEITLEPKVLKGNRWNGSGCHTNFSTKMRHGTKSKNGYLLFVMQSRN